MNMHKFLERLITYLILALILIICLFPLVWMVLTSFKNNLDIIAGPWSWALSWEATVKNYDQVWNGRRFGLYIRNSTLVTAATVIGALLLAMPCAYGLSRFDFRRKDDLVFWILSQRFMPAIAVAIPIFLTINALGLVNTYTGLILPYIALNLPLAVWILRRFIDDIPRDLDHAALVDGPVCLVFRDQGHRRHVGRCRPSHDPEHAALQRFAERHFHPWQAG